MLGQQVTYEYYGMPTDWLERYRAGIEKVTPPEVARVARQYITPDRFAILVVGPTEGRDKALSTFGTVTTLDIAIPEPPSAPAAPSSPAASSPAATDAGRTLVEKAVTAMGGATVVDGVKAYREESTAVITTPQGEIELQSNLLVAPPDRVRQEMATPMGTMTMVIAGAAGTVTGGPQGSQSLPEAQRTQTLKQVQRSPIFLLQRRAQPTFTATAAGEGRVGDTPVSLVRVEVDGDAMTLGIDPATGQIRSLLARGTGPTGAPADVLTEYGDYRVADGLSVPHARTSSIGGTTAQKITVKTVRVNPPVPADAFGTGPGK